MSRQSMKWTFDHNVMFVREILHTEPWLCKYGSTERGEAWSKIANSLNAMKEPSFKVNQRSVRDRYTHMERHHKSKVAQEERASGITPEETEVDRAMAEIIQLFEEYDRENEKLSEEKKKKAEEDVAKAEEMRRESLETFKETKKRKESEQSEIPPKKRRASGSDTMSYLKEMGEAEGKRREEEMDMRRQEMEEQSELQREEMKLRKQEMEDKRNQNEAMQQSMMMQQQQLQLLIQQQQQQQHVMMAFLEKAFNAKK
ncbi:uncharacterized protein LOC144633091 [Oculina patagonica]